jgi:Ca-activated chloride channel homolog
MKLSQTLFRITASALLTGLLVACGTAVDQQTVNQTNQLPEAVTGEVYRLKDEELMNSAPEPRREAKLKAQVASVVMQRQGLAEYDAIRMPSAGVDRENYGHIEQNGVKSTAEQPVSTFSIDVDTGAYALVRRFLNQGQMPPKDAVRAEELINYFHYDYPNASEKDRPFSLITEVGPTPWNEKSLLVHVGIQGMVPERDKRPASNLVFLVDVSGSMESNDKLPLLKSAFKLLVKQLDSADRVSLVVYAGASGVVLEPTPGDQQGKILAALERLSAGGSTHGSAGIELAYAMAEQARVEGGINRVILATDGDFNVGTVNHERLMDLIEEKRKQGITLTTLGFGQGNYNDYLMEQLADKGNGNYAYIDTINEAQKVLVDELGSTLEVIAKDVKVQIEWNPAVVAEYRLIGYENRLLAREDFSNDKVDAGDIGAGHSVTALYEIVLADGKGQRLPPLRYAETTLRSNKQDEIAFLRLRYKQPDGEKSKEIVNPISLSGIERKLSKTSDNFRFGASVAAFAELLRGGRYSESYDYEQVAGLARQARGADPFGYRGEFLRLVNLASSLGG